MMMMTITTKYIALNQAMHAHIVVTNTLLVVAEREWAVYITAASASGVGMRIMCAAIQWMMYSWMAIILIKIEACI